MKMVCKKLLSLVLVALMLVSAVPFQASAAGGSKEVKVDVFIDGVATSTKHITIDDTGVTLSAAYGLSLLKSAEGRSVEKWEDNTGKVVTDNTVTYTDIQSNGDYSLKLYLLEATQPTVHEHVWDAGTVTTPATCTTTGVKTFKCTTPDCGATKTEEIPATGHTYGDPQITTPATCGKDGTQTKTCTACGATVNETIKATGNHTWGGWVIQNEATATAEGTMIRTCSVCGATETQKYSAETKEISFQVTVNGSTTTTKSVFVINKTMSLPNPSVPAGYKFKGWFSEPNGKGTQLAEGTTCTKNLANVYYAYFTEDVKFDYNVYLNIYTDNKVDEPAKRITITNGIAKDGKVTLAEVKDVVFDYYTAKDSNGIVVDGLYMATGNWVDKFNKNDQRGTVDVSDLKEQNNVFINVMITNAKAKSDSSSSTSSNPKTGDTIYMAVTVMGLSAASLAAVYYISKKRAVR